MDDGIADKIEELLADDPTEEKRGRGRPTKYEEGYAEQAVKLCRLGATDVEIADFFGVHVSTIHRWKLDHPNFCDSLKVGKDACDDRIERSLYAKAAGYEFTEEQAIKVKVEQHKEKVEVVEVHRHSPPDTAAAIFWLKNRRSDKWRDKKEFEGNFSMNEALADLANGTS